MPINTIVSFLSLVISALSLVTAAIGSYIAYNSTKATATRQVIVGWVTIAGTLPTASKCFDFANEAPNDLVDRLFNRSSNAVGPIPDFLQESLRICLSLPTPVQSITEAQNLEIRRIIMTKLESFQEVYRAVALGEGYDNRICEEVKIGFGAGPRQFVEKVTTGNSTKPALLQNIETELKYVVDAAKGSLCQL